MIINRRLALSTLTLLAGITLVWSCKKAQVSAPSEDGLSGSQNSQPKPRKSAAEYASECAAAGVALPRGVSDTSFWNSVKPINMNFEHFNAAMGPGNLYMGADTAKGGGCVQLNTIYPGGPGTSGHAVVFAICWSKGGDVCFWEASGVDQQILNTTFDITTDEFAHPYGQLGNNCLQCHRGQNPFVGHGKLGDPTFNKFPIVRFNNPIVPAEWLNNLPPVSEKGDESYQCAGECHNIPKLTPYMGYCSVALGMMDKGLMLGTELKIKGANAPGKKTVTPPPNPSTLDELTLTQCEQYKKFLIACGQSVTQRGIGICPL